MKKWLLLPMLFCAMGLHAQKPGKRNATARVGNDAHKITLHIGSGLITKVPLGIILKRKGLMGAPGLNFKESYPLCLGITIDSGTPWEYAALFTFEHLRFEEESAPYPPKPTTVRHYSKNWFGLSIGANYRWLMKSRSALYSGVVLGVGYSTFHKIDGQFYPGEEVMKNSFFPSYQATVLGWRFGKRFGGNVELGYGYKGILTAGLYYKL